MIYKFIKDGSELIYKCLVSGLNKENIKLYIQKDILYVETFEDSLILSKGKYKVTYIDEYSEITDSKLENGILSFKIKKKEHPKKEITIQ